MKITLLLGGLIISLILTSCGQNKLETENTRPKNQIAQSESENKELQMEIELLKQQTNNNAALLTSVKSELELYKQEINKLQTKTEEENKQREDSKNQDINAAIEKIIAHLEKVMREPRDFSQENWRTEKNRLKEMANSEQTIAEEILIELKEKGFEQEASLEKVVNIFFVDYSTLAFAESFPYNFHDQFPAIPDTQYSQTFAESAQKDLDIVRGDLDVVNKFRAQK